ncbi:Predicted oxidoreductase [Bryocella elongata]|uniref:Predicted oxidoreductase n=1 Tax=Bryocella elongata TaxID=863522 RepID=A0A1H6A5E0_9BACT|nr:aldo/keto reductase [Bryocella elongata]SEG43958.1 Predicted oxidoreductase [Bryocella elongata]
MELRSLGKTDLQIVPLVLGGNVFGWTIDEAQSFAVLDAFVDRGFNCIDTADVYSAWKPGNKGGESEAILGKWLKQTGKRDKIVLLTKVGMKMPDVGEGLSKQYILSEVEASLKRLQTDAIDLYQSHKDDPNTPLDETLEAYQQLIAQGKVRFIGASNYSGERLREAEKISAEKKLPAYATLQPEYNLIDREAYEKDLAPVLAELGMGSIVYFSLASGFLTGKYQTLEDTRGKGRGSRVEKYFNDRGMKILAALKQVSAETGAQQASIALAWLLAQPTVIAPIASATSPEQLEALFAAVKLKLSEAQLKTLTDVSAY